MEAIQESTQVATLDPRALLEFNLTEAGFVELETRLGKLVYADIATVKGMDRAKKDVAEVRTLRTGIDKLRLERNKQDRTVIDVRNDLAGKLTVRCEAIEEPLKAQIDAEVARKEAIRVAAEQAELKRIADIRECISSDFVAPVKVSYKSVELLKAALDALAAMPINEATYFDLQHEAAFAKDGALTTLQARYEAACAREAQLRMIAEKEAQQREESLRLAAVAEKNRAEAAEHARLAAVEEARLAEVAKKNREDAEQLARDREAFEEQRRNFAELSKPAPVPVAQPAESLSLPGIEPVAELLARAGGDNGFGVMMKAADALIDEISCLPGVEPVQNALPDVYATAVGMAETVAKSYGVSVLEALRWLREADFYSSECYALGGAA